MILLNPHFRKRIEVESTLGSPLRAGQSVNEVIQQKQLRKLQRLKPQQLSIFLEGLWLSEEGGEGGVEWSEVHSCLSDPPGLFKQQRGIVIHSDRPIALRRSNTRMQAHFSAGSFIVCVCVGVGEGLLGGQHRVRRVDSYKCNHRQAGTHTDPPPDTSYLQYTGRLFLGAYSTCQNLCTHGVSMAMAWR